MATQLASATDQLWDRWPYLSHEQRLKQFHLLPAGIAPLFLTRKRLARPFRLTAT